MSMSSGHDRFPGQTQQELFAFAEKQIADPVRVGHRAHGARQTQVVQLTADEVQIVVSGKCHSSSVRDVAVPE
jgi:hypothetical protein